MKKLKQIGINARKAFVQLNNLDPKKINKVLNTYNGFLLKNKKQILRENSKDVKLSTRKHLVDRLILNEKRIDGIRNSINEIVKFKNPLNRTIADWRRPNGLRIKKVTTPIGVIGIIYESRPNVTADVSALSLKSGNCAILRGGSEAFNSNKILANLFRESLNKNKIDKHCVQFIENKNRKAVNYMLSNMSQYIDVVVPRGGKELVKKVQQLSRVHVIGHLEGLCHIYIDKDANTAMAVKIVANAKMRRTGICGAVETLLIDSRSLKKHAKPIIDELESLGCEIIVDKKINQMFQNKFKLAKEIDWNTEYLDAKISIKSVNGVYEAKQHILKYGTMHTDSIITNNSQTAKIFLKSVNSSIAMHNVSTQFADGGEFGFGGEIGISTNKLPPRGPVGINQLTSYKYIVLGKGTIRS
ncbi:glutamate-5-semialdehyde dehydrogenase [Pelagibacteraceae bacterium]|nr:glutamate-5-semialdehyde dehydrogenase [Pelagibacteraceae bacterium]